MTDAEDIQLEKAKIALPKSTPGPWEVDGRLINSISERPDGWRIVCILHQDANPESTAPIIAAAPLALRRVIELEAEVAWLKEWQKKALPHIQHRYYEDESQVQTVEFELPEWEKSPGYRAVVQACKERLPELSWLINQTQEGGRE